MTIYRQVTLLCAFFGLIGISLLIVGAIEAFDVRTFVNTAQPAVGRVIDLKFEEHFTKGQSTGGYWAIFEFSDTKGKTHTCSSTSAQNPAPYQIGDAVTILYRPESPQDARIRNFKTLWLLPTILCSLGAVFTVVGIVAFAASRKSYGPKT